ncbi:MAG TPA: hypothetical protein VFP98_04355 [Candidatus Polarisedimenticolia bacterium]|nr:hypothetical protein [Candidatus Polarisedimenticolia bacterium]
MRLMPIAAASMAVMSALAFYSCDDDDHAVFVDDVTVELTGDSGTQFDAFFEDDHHTQSATGTVPFAADFENQVDFFYAEVDKLSSGGAELCVRVTSSHESRQRCTTDPFGRVSVLIRF